MKKDLERILDDCIDRMNRGESAQECLKAYPKFAVELQPLLKVADELRRQAAYVPSAAAKAEGKKRLDKAIAESRQRRRKPGSAWLERLLMRPRVWAPLAAALVLAFMAYGLWSALQPHPTPIVYAGILEIRVTDAPKHDVSAVNITIGDIEVHREDQKPEVSTPRSDAESGWITVIPGNRSFELLELLGVEQVLGSKELEAGHYTQIRMAVRDVTVTVDGNPRDAKLPSGKLKLVGSFDIEQGKTTAVTLDFDAAESVVVTGNGGVIFKPVVKLLVAKAR